MTLLSAFSSQPSFPPLSMRWKKSARTNPSRFTSAPCLRSGRARNKDARHRAGRREVPARERAVAWKRNCRGLQRGRGGWRRRGYRADGLEAGADDYITATVESREFLARIRAVLRRTRPAGPARRIVRVGELEIDLERRSLRQNGTPIHLTRREFDLLALMMQKPGASFTHAQLLRSVWGPDYGSELEYLRAYVRLLRRKIDVDPEKPSCIRTVPGVGYCFQGTLDL